MMECCNTPMPDTSSGVAADANIEILDLQDLVDDAPPVFQSFDEFFAYYFPADASDTVMADDEGSRHGESSEEEKHDDILNESKDEDADDSSRTDRKSGEGLDSSKIEGTSSANAAAKVKMFPAAALVGRLSSEAQAKIASLSDYDMSTVEHLLVLRAGWDATIVSNEIVAKFPKSHGNPQLTAVSKPSAYVSYERKHIKLSKKVLDAIEAKYDFPFADDVIDKYRIHSWAEAEKAWEETVIMLDQVLHYNTTRNKHEGPYTFMFVREWALISDMFGENIYYQERTFCIACRHNSTKGDLHPWCWRCYVLSGYIVCGVEGQYCHHCGKMSDSALAARKSKILKFTTDEATMDDILAVVKHLNNNKLSMHVITHFDALVYVALQMFAVGEIKEYPVPRHSFVSLAKHFGVKTKTFKLIHGVEPGEKLRGDVQTPRSRITSKSLFKKGDAAKRALDMSPQDSESAGSSQGTRAKRPRADRDYKLFGSGDTFSGNEGGDNDDVEQDQEQDDSLEPVEPKPKPPKPASAAIRPKEWTDLPNLAMHKVLADRLNQYMTQGTAKLYFSKKTQTKLDNPADTLFLYIEGVTININFPWTVVWAAMAGIGGMAPAQLKQSKAQGLTPKEGSTHKVASTLGQMIRGQQAVTYVPLPKNRYLLKFVADDCPERLATPVEIYLGKLINDEVPPPEFAIKSEPETGESGDDVLVIEPPVGRHQSPAAAAKKQQLAAAGLDTTTDLLGKVMDKHIEKLDEVKVVTPPSSLTQQSPGVPGSSEKPGSAVKTDQEQGDALNLEAAASHPQPLTIYSHIDNARYDYQVTPSIRYLHTYDSTVTADAASLLTAAEFAHGALPHVDLKRERFGVLVGSGDSFETITCESIANMTPAKIKETLMALAQTNDGVMDFAPIHTISWYNRLSAMKTLDSHELQLIYDAQPLLVPAGYTSNDTSAGPDQRPFVPNVNIGPRLFFADSTLTPTGELFLQRRAEETQRLLSEVDGANLLTTLFVNRNLNILTLPYLRRQTPRLRLTAMGAPVKQRWNTLRGTIDSRFAYPITDVALRYSEELSRLKFYTCSQREHDADWIERHLLQLAEEIAPESEHFAAKVRMIAAQAFNRLYYHILDDYAIEAEQLSHIVYMRRQGFLSAMPHDRKRIVRGLSQKIVDQRHILE